MDKCLCSVGLDVGTTTTQLVVSKLYARNRASSFAAPQMEITQREVVYQSPVRFTPLISGELVDGEAIRKLVEEDYRAAGITPETVDTGAVIITGETSRKENAAAVLHALSNYAGKFVVATAGPELESVLAARGAGAVAESRDKTVLHMDIGGGTCNLALCREGEIVATGCLNVGGRLLKLKETGEITYISPVLQGIIPEKCGDLLTERRGMEIAALLVSVLEMAVGYREKTEIFTHFTTAGTAPVPVTDQVTVSLSGGVADCVQTEVPWLAYGDLGPLLGKAIRESTLCSGPYRLGHQTIRATVIGAGCHSVRLSGSTIHRQNTPLPLHNLPVAVLSDREQDLPPEALERLIRQRMDALEDIGVLHLPGWNAPSYGRIKTLAKVVRNALGERPCYVALDADMAKALGTALALEAGPAAQILCIDGIHAHRQSYLDIGAPVGPALTVVVKTLIFEK